MSARRFPSALAALSLAASFLAAPCALLAQDAPKILLDQPLRAVEYQLGRLTNEELVLVERKDSDVKYRPVYVAILTRKGVPQQSRDEAVTALVTMDKTSRSRVLLDGLAKLPADDPVTIEKLIAMLVSQPADSVRKERAIFVEALDAPSGTPVTRRGAYAAILVADGKPQDAWQLAQKHQGQVVDFLGAVRYVPSSAKLGEALYPVVSETLKTSPDATTRAAAAEALGWTRLDAETFELLAREVKPDADAGVRTAAISSLERIPDSAWPPAGIEPLARALVAVAAAIPPEARTEPWALDAIQFGERLADRLPDESKRSVRRELRALGVQVVRIGTIPEKLTYDLRWFAVEAGKPVQVVLFNRDAMPHNLIVGAPGSLEAIGTAGGAMPMPTDPEAKAFVPDSPEVLFSTKLVKEGETERLGFTAPKKPGEYIFVCTFPGHWVRMYGVMLVVDNLEAWDAKPTTPIDPMTKQPFTSKQP
jgi:uncharacterized cupredoxin-like copper-binding protein